LRWRPSPARGLVRELGAAGYDRPVTVRVPRAWLVGALAAAPAAAADGEWPIFRGDPGLTGIARCELPASAGDLGVLWSYDTKKPVVSSPVVADGRVFIGSDDHCVHAIDLESGEGLWRFATEDMVEAPPLVREGRVICGSSDTRVYAIDAESGAELWRFEGGDQFLGGANWLEPEGELPARVVVGCYDTKLYCLDAASGEKLWEYATDNYINGTPAVAGQRVVVGGCDAALHVLDGRDGKPIRRIELGEASHVAGSVALAGGRAYLGHYGNAFVCVDLEGGETLWSVTDPSQAFFSSPALAPDRVVFGGRNKRVHCVERSSGKELWSFATRRKVDSSPVVAGDKVVVGSGDGRLYVLDLESGAELWSYEVGRSIYSSPAVAAGRILIGSDDGLVLCFGAAE
jgi:outer membrane protein assembly factor BamB